MLITGNVKWNATAEVIIVGLGAAGAIAAITAHDLGAKVVILEKQHADTHVSTSHMAGAGFALPTDPSIAPGYLERLAKADGDQYWTDKESIRVFAQYLSGGKTWLEKMGGKVEEREGRVGQFHNVPGRDTWKNCHFAGAGPGLMRLLKKHVESRGIQVLYAAPAKKLLTNIHSEVVGVRAESNGNQVDIKASKAVILTTGGFEFNEEMKLNYLRVYPTYFAGSPANTGDGIKMAQDVGASLWHMNCCSASWVMKFPGLAIGYGPNFRGSIGGENVWFRDAVAGNPCGYIIVDKYGRRYTNEEFHRNALYYELAMYDSQRLEFPRVPSFWIFDRKRIESGPLTMMWYGPMLCRKMLGYNWSRDNQEELRKGWIIEGLTVPELAKKLNISQSQLAKSVRSYNRYCQQKEDPEFHRPPQHLVPLNEPPYYAVELWPGSANTQGGPRRNHKCQILDTDAKPIPRLYSAGELGSFWGMIYQGGGNIAECIASGRIAGESAAGEK